MKNYNNYYATNQGIIYNKITGKQMRVWLDKGAKGGYMRIKLTDDSGKRTHWLVNRFVYTYFLGNIPKGYEIDHVDGNRTNNALNNLRIVTHKQNMALKNKKRIEA